MQTIQAWRVRGWGAFTRHLVGGALALVRAGLGAREHAG